MSLHKREIRRQIFHMAYGPIIVGLYHYGIIDLNLLFGVVIGGALVSLMVKKQRLNPIKKLLSVFERDHHLENFPGRGILFFTLGAYLTLLLFPANLAYAGILVLSFGDAASNLVGRHFGKIKMKLNPSKNIEGSIVGILVSVPIAYYFVPNIAACIAAATIAMFLEMPHIRFGGFEIDDNLLIPLGASFTLSLFM